MMTEIEDFRTIYMLVDEDNNIAIFPYSKSDIPIERISEKDGDFKYFPAYYPIEIKAPYTVEELAIAIEKDMNEWNKHPYYYYIQHKNKTLEELYYNIKNFNKAMKGKSLIYLGWNSMWGKYVSINLPDKRGYGYTGKKRFIWMRMQIG